jgi:hypothetical protein
MNDIKIDVDSATLMTLEVQKFDKKIAEMKAQVADLKRQKAAYIFDTNIQILLAKQKPAAPQSPAS